MHQAAHVTAGTATASTVVQAREIPALKHAEAAEMATVELERFIQLVETLEGQDWTQPTLCTKWSVREIVAHQAGACAAFASWAEFKRQNMRNPYLRSEPFMVDGMNRLQVEDRAQATPAQLIAELREVGPRAVRTRRRLPALLRALRVKIPAPIGRWTRIDYLTDTIYTRDMWMHRYDICHATRREMLQTPEHDGRIIALVVRELNDKIARQLPGRSVRYELTGVAGGNYLLGQQRAPEATIRMSALDFAVLASERISLSRALEQGLIAVEGDQQLARQALSLTSIPF